MQKHSKSLTGTVLFVASFLISSSLIHCLIGPSADSIADASILALDGPAGGEEDASLDDATIHQNDAGEPYKAAGDTCGGQGRQSLPGLDGSRFLGPPAFCDPSHYIEKGRPGIQSP